jgi:hypothetical protein
MAVVPLASRGIEMETKSSNQAQRWADFLTDIGMKEYVPAFVNNGFDVIDLDTWKKEFTEERLKEIGVTKMAHRMQLVKHIRAAPTLSTQERAKMDPHHGCCQTPNGCYCTPRAYCKRLNSCWHNAIDRDNVTVSAIDTKMTMISVVNALILTIPFAIQPYVGYAAYDALLIQTTACNVSSFVPDPLAPNEFFTPKDYVYHTYSLLMRTLLLCIFSPLMTLLVIVVYYIIRPGTDTPEQSPSEIGEMSSKHGERIVNASFRVWWPCGGRLLAFFAALGTVMSVLALCVLAMAYHRNFVAMSTDFCTEVYRRHKSADGAYLAVAFLVATILLFGF